MIKENIDEFTIMILLNEKSKKQLKNKFWDDFAKEIICEIETALWLVEIFGTKTETKSRNLEGYTDGYSYGEHDFYFRVCFNERFNKMGVAIRFSAQSLKYYNSKFLEATGTCIYVFDFIKKLTYALPDYEVRFSRIDHCVDFIDENIPSVNEIYEDLKNGYEFYTSKGVKNPSKITAYSSNLIVETINIGSKQKGKQTTCRIYDKRIEQLKTKGIQFEEAKNCKSWIRFENEIHGKYAHNLTKEILKMETEVELCELTIRVILNKYSIRDKDGNDHLITKKLKDIKNNNDYYYSINKYNNTSLEKNIEYITNNSGLISFLYKLSKINASGPNDFCNYAIEKANHHIPNKDTRRWLDRNGEFYQSCYLTDIKPIFDTKDFHEKYKRDK